MSKAFFDASDALYTEIQTREMSSEACCAEIERRLKSVATLLELHREKLGENITFIAEYQLKSLREDLEGAYYEGSQGPSERDVLWAVTNIERALEENVGSLLS